MKGIAAVCICFVGMLFSLPLFAASFDCATVKTYADKLVCKDPQLSAMDDKLDIYYRKVEATTPDKEAFKNNMLAAWVDRDQRCHDRACVVQWYNNRIALLSDPAFAKAIWPKYQSGQVEASASIENSQPSKASPRAETSESANKGFQLRFRTINYASTVCVSARMAADANLITQGVSLFDDPEADAQWMEKHKNDGECHTQSPDKGFLVTPAIPVYLNEAMVIWVVGIKVPSNGQLIGYIPIDQIQIIPIPTL